MSTETKTTTFTLENFYAWLMETPDTVINHRSITTCALGQYVSEHEDPAYKGLSHFNRAVIVAHELPAILQNILLDGKRAVSRVPTHLALAKFIETFLQDIKNYEKV